MKNKIYPKFIYLSQLINLQIFDHSNGRTIGRIIDITAEVREMYPRISGLILKSKKGKARTYIPWDCIKTIAEKNMITIDNYSQW